MASSSSLSWLIETPIIMEPYFGAIVTAWPLFDTNSDNPDHGSTNRVNRIILFNVQTQEMTVIRETDTRFDDILNDITITKEGQPPASQVVIDGLPVVEIKGGTEEIESLGGECVICLEEWKVGDMAKVMPCKHKFHVGCVERWLKVHGSCPVCRHKMPLDGLDDNMVLDESGRRRRRERWVILAFDDEES